MAKHPWSTGDVTHGGVTFICSRKIEILFQTDRIVGSPVFIKDTLLGEDFSTYKIRRPLPTDLLALQLPGLRMVLPALAQFQLAVQQ